MKIVIGGNGISGLAAALYLTRVTKSVSCRPYSKNPEARRESIYGALW